MYLSRIFCVLFLEAAVCIAAFAQQAFDPKVKQKTFHQVWSIINSKFYDPNFNGVDWKAMRMKYAPQVAQAKTESELYEVLTRMLEELKVSHVGILTPSDIAKMGKPATTTGLGLRMVENQITVTRILPDSSAEKEGLKTGFLIKSVDGTKVKTLDEALPKMAGDAGILRYVPSAAHNRR